jgi:hypothetical protein
MHGMLLMWILKWCNIRFNQPAGLLEWWRNYVKFCLRTLEVNTTYTTYWQNLPPGGLLIGPSIIFYRYGWRDARNWMQNPSLLLIFVRYREMDVLCLVCCQDQFLQVLYDISSWHQVDKFKAFFIIWSVVSLSAMQKYLHDTSRFIFCGKWHIFKG